LAHPEIDDEYRDGANRDGDPVSGDETFDEGLNDDSGCDDPESPTSPEGMRAAEE
jgi:hypothetical protein